MLWFSKKPSDIKNVIVFGNGCFFKVNSSLKNISYVENEASISAISIVNARFPNLAIWINQSSFLRTQGCEVIYLLGDEKSEKIALEFVKKFKKKFKKKEINIKGLIDSDAGYQSVYLIKNIERKLLIKLPVDETLIGMPEFILGFIEGL